jgi:serine/threonine protein kinase
MKDNDCTGASTYYAHPLPAAPADPGLHAFFTSATEAKRYTVQEVIGKGSYGVVCAAVDNISQEKVRRICGFQIITNVSTPLQARLQAWMMQSFCMPTGS